MPRPATAPDAVARPKSHRARVADVGHARAGRPDVAVRSSARPAGCVRCVSAGTRDACPQDIDRSPGLGADKMVPWRTLAGRRTRPPLIPVGPAQLPPGCGSAAAVSFARRAWKASCRVVRRLGHPTLRRQLGDRLRILNVLLVAFRQACGRLSERAGRQACCTAVHPKGYRIACRLRFPTHHVVRPSWRGAPRTGGGCSSRCRCDPPVGPAGRDPTDVSGA